MAKETQIQIRLTKDEKTILDRASAGAGSFTSSWLRDLGMREARRLHNKAAKANTAGSRVSR